jgi:hypothetical protein
MERADIQERIAHFTNLINRDAGYTVAHIRVVAEQTLALWAVAEQITEAVAASDNIRNELREVHKRIEALELTMRGGFAQLTQPR